MRTSVKCGKFTVTIHRRAVDSCDDGPRTLILRVWRGRPAWVYPLDNLIWQKTEPLSEPAWIAEACEAIQAQEEPAMILDFIRDNGLTVEMEEGR